MTNEIILAVEDAPEGKHTAKAFGESIFTEGESLDEIRSNIREAVENHFDPGTHPKIIRLHYVKEEVMSL